MSAGIQTIVMAFVGTGWLVGFRLGMHFVAKSSEKPLGRRTPPAGQAGPEVQSAAA